MYKITEIDKEKKLIYFVVDSEGLEYLKKPPQVEYAGEIYKIDGPVEVWNHEIKRNILGVVFSYQTAEQK